jgi:D-alanine-D-alanine ligase
MDKILSKQLYSLNDIPTAPWVELQPGEFGEAGARRVENEIGLPAVVKHPAGGSSLGVFVARDRPALLQAILEIGKEAPRLLVEAFLPGREATCGVLEGLEQPLPPTEIRPREGSFFSFEAKYQAGLTDEVTPATFPSDVLAKIQKLARRCHDALRLSVYSRTDFIWTPSTGSTGSPQAGSGTGRLFALETNNLPGFTPTSILPQQAAHLGISYSELVTHILEKSLQQCRALRA